MIHVISTGLNPPTKQRCLDSILAQKLGAEFKFDYVDAANQKEPLCALENFTNAARLVSADDILVSLDGDDWFPHERVLQHIANVYWDPNVWLTYGSFAFADGRPGFASQYTHENFRGDEWRATHLKTFRAALFHRLGDAELKRNGTFRDLCWDMAVMFPMLEMCGLEHSRFVPEVLYVYNYANSFEHNSTAAERQREREMNMELRSLPRRKKLDRL